MEGRKFSLIFVGFCLVLFLCVIDEVAGHQVSPSFLYLVPVVVIAYMVSRQIAVYMSILSAVGWLIVDLRSSVEWTSPYIHVWNLVVRLGFFLFITYGISLLIRARQRQEELVSFIVHDLKTPLTSMIIVLKHLGEIIDKGDSKLRRFAHHGLASANRMLTMVHSLVDQPKLENGKYILNLEEVSVEKIVDTSIDQISVWAETNKVVIEKNIYPEAVSIKTDFWLVIRVLTNLLSNAIKVSPADSVIKVGALGSDGKVSFSVSDQGPGIAEKWRKKVFDKFYHLEARKEGVPTGSGLGLTFCQSAVKQLNGHIYLESEVGKGSTFIFEVPL